MVFFNQMLLEKLPTTLNRSLKCATRNSILFTDSLHQLVHCGKLFPHFKLNLEIKISRFGPIFKYFYKPIFLQFNRSLYWKMFLLFKECFQRILRKMTFQIKIFDRELTLQSWKYSNNCNFSIQIIVENA